MSIRTPISLKSHLCFLYLSLYLRRGFQIAPVFRPSLPHLSLIQYGVIQKRLQGHRKRTCHLICIQNALNLHTECIFHSYSRIHFQSNMHSVCILHAYFMTCGMLMFREKATPAFEHLRIRLKYNSRYRKKAIRNICSK